MGPRSARRIIRKRSFLLFELLICLALITLCLFPLITPHAKMHRADLHYLEEIQLERIADQAFSQIKVRLYENQHPWEMLLEEALEETFPIYTSKDFVKWVSCHYTTQFLEKADKPSLNKTGIVICITMRFSPSLLENRPFTRTLYLEERRPA
jgi:hypothetical protein